MTSRSTKGLEKTESKDTSIEVHTGHFFADTIGKDVIEALEKKFGSLDTDRPFLMHPSKIGQIIVCAGFTKTTSGTFIKAYENEDFAVHRDLKPSDYDTSVWGLIQKMAKSEPLTVDEKLVLIRGLATNDPTRKTLMLELWETEKDSVSLSSSKK